MSQHRPSSNKSQTATIHFIHRLKEMGVYSEVVDLIRPRGVTIEDIISRNRHKNIAAARHEIMYWIRAKLKWSYPEIGKLFQRDHTTVLSACRKIHLENPTFGDAYLSMSDPGYDASDWIVR